MTQDYVHNSSNKMKKINTSGDIHHATY